MSTALAPASISLSFRACGESSAVLSIHGHYSPEMHISIQRYGFDEEKREISGNACLNELHVEDDDAVVIVVKNHCGEVVACGFYCVQMAYMEYGVILSPSPDNTLEISQSHLREGVVA